jgi:hypothetical protein
MQAEKTRHHEWSRGTPGGARHRRLGNVAWRDRTVVLVLVRMLTRLLKNSKGPTPLKIGVTR